MTNVEIKSFEEVILFELQKLLQANADRRLEFGQIWKSCAAASVNLENCPTVEEKRRFAHKVLSAIENLGGTGLAALHTKGSYPTRVTHITATSRGIDYLKSVVFTNQERMVDMSLNIAKESDNGHR